MSKIVSVKLSQIERFKEFIAYASFDSNPEVNNRAIAINHDVLKQELDNLFKTKKYERPYDPDYYNPLEELIGELWKSEYAYLAIQAVTNKISKYVPRIVVDQSNTYFEWENYKLSMGLVFYYRNDYDKTLYEYKRQFDTVT